MLAFRTTRRLITGVAVTALLLSASTWTAEAQSPAVVAIQGQVVEAETNAPLPGAHVFIAQSMIGTTTDSQGRYQLDRVPVGATRLYVSMLGYEPEARDLMIRASEQPLVEDFRLAEGVLELDEVTVVGVRDPNWERHLKKFVRLFIGETPNAAHARILNPEVLSFSETLGQFAAVASEPLLIENRALGYRVQYFLDEFKATPTRTSYDGEALFEEMPAPSPEIARQWEGLRRQAWYGSFRHFILSVLDQTAEEKGYHIYSRPDMGETQVNPSVATAGSAAGILAGRQRFPLEPDDLYDDGETEQEKTLNFHGFVEILFTGELETDDYRSWRGAAHGGSRRDAFQTSWIRLERGPAIVDYKGDVLDPYGVTFYGFLAFERVADELPKEYRPQ